MTPPVTPPVTPQVAQHPRDSLQAWERRYARVTGTGTRAACDGNSAAGPLRHIRDAAECNNLGWHPQAQSYYNKRLICFFAVGP